jgi:SagB-type dehydrogenase family enzyme
VAPRRSKKQTRKAAPASAVRGLVVRLLQHVALEVSTAGDVALAFDGRSVAVGRLSAEAAERARGLRAGLPLSLFAAPKRSADKEVDTLARRLAARGLIEYRLGHPRGGGEQAVIEPQVPDYWPQIPRLRDADSLVLSRFAYLRRRADELVLESPRSGALFKIRDAKIGALLAGLATPQKVKVLRQQAGFPGVELLALLLDAQILFKVTAADKGLRPTEGDDDLVLWDFHDLLFHARSTEGRHANPVGGLYAYVETIAPQPAVRPSWPGEKIDLARFVAGEGQNVSPAAKLFTERHSTRDFDDRNPITLAELSRLLEATARVTAVVETPHDPQGDPASGGPALAYTVRPYPSGGASYELELYLAVNICEGLPRGFYHYDAGAHVLVPIAVRNQDFNALLNGAEFAMGTSAAPQILITIAARFGRVSWKYSSIAYSLILKDTGVLMQTLYLMAADMGLGGCAIGTTNIDLFAKMTGLGVHAEGAVGQFALGRAAKPGS